MRLKCICNCDECFSTPRPPSDAPVCKRALLIIPAIFIYNYPLSLAH